MPYQIVEHTADMRMRVWGKDLEELFRAGVSAVMELIKPEKTRPAPPPAGPSLKTRQVVLASQDTTSLLVDFLNAVITSTHINKEIYTQVKFARLSPTELKAELAAEKVEEFKEDIKAVTYHEAEVKQAASGDWETVLVFDI